MIIDFYNRGGGGSGSGVTTGQVQSMITSALTAEEETLYTDLQNSVDIPVTDAQMTGLTPTDMESNDGSIFKSTNGTYWEGFNKENKFIQRKGVYNRTVNVPALSAFTDAQEGDIANVVTTGGTSWIEISAQDFDDICQEDKWVRGATYKVTGDTTETYTGNKAMRGAFVTTGETETSVFLGFGFRKNVGYGFEFGNSQSWTAWDGSERTFTVPEDYDEWQLYMFSIPDELVTVFQQTASTPSQTQYQRINGQWVEPVTGSVTTGQVSDMISSALTAEEGTLYTDLQNSLDVPLSDNQMTGVTPTDMESNDGSIFVSTNGTYWEGFNKDNVFIQRKGVYNRTVNVTALTDFNDAKEGDIAVLITTASSETWVSLSISEYKDILDNMSWGNNPNFKFSVDTSVTQTNTWRIGVCYGDESMVWIVGYGLNGEMETEDLYWDNYGEYTGSWSDTGETYARPWDGSEMTMALPTPIDENLFPITYDGTPVGLNIWQQQNVVTSSQTQYQMVNGQWTKVYRNVMISQADYDALSGNTDSNTIYNITGTTS